MYEPEHATLEDAPDKMPSIGETIWQRAMKWLHSKRNLTPDMLAEQPASDMIDETNRVFNHAISTGIEYEIPDAMRRKLQEDVFVFSGCKSYIKLKEASLLLTDRETGKVKPFDKFYKDVIGIHKTYDKQYLQAEYHYAVGASQMASKWAKFEADGDRYLLQYRTAKDERVRDSHARLADTTLPLSDPFWDRFTPPLGWRCRCTVVQVRPGKYQESDSREKQAIAEGCTTGKLEMFRYNPGKQQVVFPPHHPYYKVKSGIGDVLERLKTHLQRREDTVSDLRQWVKTALPTVKVGKFEAKRFEVKRSDLDQSVVVNANFYNELIAHYKTDKNYVRKLELSMQADRFIKEAEFLREEKPRHGNAKRFLVYEHQHEGVNIELKCKETNDGIYLYYMMIK